MKTSSLFAIAFILCLGSPAWAEISLSAGVEYFSWTEDTDPIEVEERGPLAVIGLDYTQSKPRGLALAYRGRVYAGKVDYEGALLFFPHIPATATTRYTGTAHEVQLRFRSLHAGGMQTDIVTGVGIDLWERKLSTSQQEDYRILFARLGLELNAARDRGWSAGIGIKYPFWTKEDANLRDEGYDQNPKMEPEGGLSLYALLGYRFTRHLGVQAYLDGFNLRESDPIRVTGGGQTFYFQQPTSRQYNLGLRLHYFF